MRKRLIFGLAALNVLLALAIWVVPAHTQSVALAFNDCCQGHSTQSYCCENCCWFTNNCTTDSDCQPN